MEKTRDYRFELEQIRGLMNKGQITHAEAKELAAPIIAEINRKGAEIAKLYGKKHKTLTFGYLMR